MVPQHRVLLVEDNRVDALMIRRAFSQAGAAFDFCTVGGLEEARAVLEEGPPPSAVVIDLRLPDGSGLDLLAWLKQRPHLANLPVIVLTGSGNRQLDRAYDLGAHFYLLKPLESEGLADLLAAFGLLEASAARHSPRRAGEAHEVPVLRHRF
jgi:CheY-like chemotaxis protein